MMRYGTTITVLGIYPREMKTYVHRKTCTKLLIAAESEQPRLDTVQLSGNRRTNKQFVEQSHNMTVLSNQKEKTIDTHKNMADL